MLPIFFAVSFGKSDDWGVVVASLEGADCCIFRFHDLAVERVKGIVCEKLDALLYGEVEGFQYQIVVRIKVVSDDSREQEAASVATLSEDDVPLEQT